MSARRFLLLLWLAVLLPTSFVFAQQPRFKVLAFYSESTEGDHVQFAHDAVVFLADHAAREHFAFDATTRWEDLNDQRCNQQVIGQEGVAAIEMDRGN